jgi:isopenicillin N synthase-like dioxygenase
MHNASDLRVRYTAPDAASEFARALRDTGFAVVSDHPVAADLVAETYREWAAFFAGDAKTGYLYDPDTYWGYYPYRSEHAKDRDVKDLKEFFHVYAWSPIPADMSDRTRRLFGALDDLATTLLGWLDDATPADVRARFSMPLSEMIAGSRRTLLRVLHYPPIDDDADPSALRASAHEDINLLTLLPAGTAPGLEIERAPGVWRDVAAEPGDIVVNAGDMLQTASGGFYRSTTHRVVNPAGDARRTSRYSMPFFLHPRPEIRLSEGRTAGEYLDERLAEIGLRDPRRPS